MEQLRLESVRICVGAKDLSRWARVRKWAFSHQPCLQSNSLVAVSACSQEQTQSAMQACHASTLPTALVPCFVQLHAGGEKRQRRQVSDLVSPT
jgi:hypothetical protein